MDAMKKLAIVGMGLMGGSLGLAARRWRVAECVSAYARRPETREQARRAGVADEVPDTLAEAVRDASLVVYCVPILSIPPLVAESAPHLSSDCVVTDVGSTKSELHRTVPPALERCGARFVGSHPMAGSEETGLAAARENLYEGAVTVVTVDSVGSLTGDAAVRRVRSMWEALGSRVVTMDPATHDRIVARTSHLPHLIAALLVANAFRGESDAAALLCGSGFRDTTRIAAGSEDVWTDIVRTNRSAIGEELGRLAEAISDLKGLIDDGQFERVRQMLASSRAQRQSFGRKDG
jgi:prephenate dehydrogenase